MSNSPDVVKDPILEVMGLTKYFPIKNPIWKLGGEKQQVKAVSNISFVLNEGETFGLVGESGSGKSTTGRTILRLIESTGGKVFYNNKDILRVSNKELRNIRKDIQMVFQDPYSSLNPKKRIGKILEEPLIIHGNRSKKERTEWIMEVLYKVGMRPEHYYRYPHEFSGGQRQRIGLARALVVSPKIIICDEPVSALDVSIQSQVINLLQELQSDFKLTLLFIAHDLSVVRHISDRIGVMYLGNIVEQAPTESIFSKTLHPYTKALLSSVPQPDIKKRRERIVLKGEIPSPVSPPSGCVFHTRCPAAMSKCIHSKPVEKEVYSGHYVSCHLY